MHRYDQFLIQPKDTLYAIRHFVGSSSVVSCFKFEILMHYHFPFSYYVLLIFLLAQDIYEHVVTPKDLTSLEYCVLHIGRLTSLYDVCWWINIVH